MRRMKMFEKAVKRSREAGKFSIDQTEVTERIVNSHSDRREETCR